jgi:hypothetical protein
MTKSGKDDNKMAKMVVDAILLLSFVSVFVFWGLIKVGVIGSDNMKWIFLPGYSLMFISLGLSRLAMIDIHDNEEETK